MESSQKFPLTKQIIRDLYLVFLSVQWCISTLAYGLYFICRFALKNICKFIFLVFFLLLFFHCEGICGNSLHSYKHQCIFWLSSLLVVVCTFQAGSCLFQVKGRLKSAFLSPLLFSPVAHRGGCDKEKGTQADC